MRTLFMVLLISLLVSMALGQNPTERSVGPATAPATAYVVALDGEVNDFTQTMLAKRLEIVRQSGCKNVILRINTWGGSALSAIEISQLLKRQHDLHIVAFVDHKAISAGAMIAIACDEIVMEPGSQLGDCAPIVPGVQLEATERAKSEGPIIAEFTDSAERHHYDPLLVTSMVSVGRVVHYVENSSGERRFVDAAAFAELTRDGAWKPVQGLPNPVDSETSLLTVTAEQAVKLGLAKSLAGSPQALAAERGLAIVDTLEHGFGEHLIAFLSSDLVRGALSVVLMLSLYAAFHAPGHGAPEALVVAILAVLIGVPWLTGYAGWLEIILIVAGIGLLAAEIFVIPGFGLPGISGIIMVLAGLTLTFTPSEPNFPGFFPSLNSTYDAMWRGVVTITMAMACSLALGAWLNRYLPQLPFFNRLVLTTTVGSEIEGSYATMVDGPVWPEIGAVGRALTDLRPGGTAAFADPVTQDLQTANVVSDTGFVDANTQIIVQEVHGNRVIVRPTETA